MSSAATKFIVLGAGALVLAGVALAWVVKRHDRKFAVAASVAAAFAMACSRSASLYALVISI